MRRLLLLAGLLAGLCGMARGEEPAAAPEAAAPRPVARGYTFSDPRLLTQQLLWGLVHGVSLLADSCRDRPDGEAAGLTYADWLDRQHARIAAAARDLARHYYGEEQVPLDALTFALQLKPALNLPLEEQAAACASFSQALASERYDLQLFYDLRRDAARLARAEAVHAAVGRCRPQLKADDQAALDGAAAAWESANGATETLARTRVAGSMEESKELAQWQREAGSGAVPAAVPCADLAASLARPSHSLATVFGEEESR